MSNLDNAPEEVCEVHRLMVQNAIESGGDEDYVYSRAVHSEYEEEGTWIVACNFENFGDSMIWKPTSGWHYRESWSGEDRPMKHGFEEAKGNARCFFTG